MRSISTRAEGPPKPPQEGQCVCRNLTADEIIKPPVTKLTRNTAAEATNVKRSTEVVVGGICLGTILYYSWRWYQGLRKIRDFHLTNEDLEYSDRSAEELLSAQLIDLNRASIEQIIELGISAESAERLLENRPYRNKLELVSRMVLSQEEYSPIKDKVSVAKASESVKIA
jgi:hypothetical protein